MKTVGNLFDRNRPFQVTGLRGDEHLWAAMRQELRDTPLPQGRDLLQLESELRQLLESEFERLTGVEIHPYRDLMGCAPEMPRTVYVRQHDPGHGMSGGQIVPEFWAKTAIPLLLDRFAGEYEQSNGGARPVD